ncbi:hypothetical protein ACIMS1_004465 [Vibrio harveyi]
MSNKHIKIILYTKKINNFILKLNDLDGRKKKDIQLLSLKLYSSLKNSGAKFNLYSNFNFVNNMTKSEVLMLAQNKLKMLDDDFYCQYENVNNSNIEQLENKIVNYLFQSELKARISDLSKCLYIKGEFTNEELNSAIYRLLKTEKINVTHSALGSFYFIDKKNNWIFDGEANVYVHSACNYHCSGCSHNLDCIFQPKHRIIQEFKKLINIGLDFSYNVNDRKYLKHDPTTVGSIIRFYRNVIIDNKECLTKGVNYSVIKSDSEFLFIIDNNGELKQVSNQDPNWFSINQAKKAIGKSKSSFRLHERKLANGYISEQDTRREVVSYLEVNNNNWTTMNTLIIKLGKLRNPINKALASLLKENMLLVRQVGSECEYKLKL